MLLYNKNWLLLLAFDQEYKQMMGKYVPYKALGFQSTYDLVLSCPEVVEMQQLASGHILLLAVPDEKTGHMARWWAPRWRGGGPAATTIASRRSSPP